MEIYPKISDVDNEQFFVCSYCHKKIIANDISDDNAHIKTHYQKRIIKPAYKDVVAITKLVKNDKNVISVFQMRNYYPEIFITVYDYENFIKLYKYKLKSNTSCHVYQKRTIISDFCWKILDKRILNPMILFYVNQIKISPLCVGNCVHYGTLIRIGNVWFEIPIMFGAELLMFYNIMSEKDKNHFFKNIAA